MDPDGRAAERWPIDLEATVAKNVRWLREARDLSQEQLGSDLALHGFGMSSRTVAHLEGGARPLRLNEVAAIAAYFGLPVEALWKDGAELLNEPVPGAQTTDPEQIVADYYTQQRIERLRDK
jgi:transcriptional regulator with XRE-family HTH domain